MTDEKFSLPRRQLIKVAALGSAALTLANATTGFAKSIAADAAGPLAQDLPFDTDWKFFLGDAEGAQQPDFADAGWRLINLPHDWSIEDRPGAPKQADNWMPPVMLARQHERPADAPTLTPQIPIVVPYVPPATADGPPLRVGPFDPKESAVGWATGWTVGGVGWYRKPFALNALAPGEQMEIIFDGAYLVTEVWLNGASLGRNLSGYQQFTFDLTPHLRADGPNVLAVRVANEGKTARWYSGSGLYRHVWLRRTGAVRVPNHGVSVTTTAATPQSATLGVVVEVENRGPDSKPVECRIDIVDGKGRKVASTAKSLSVESTKTDRLAADITLANPALWSPESPSLYHAEVTLLVDGRVTDRQNLRFGIRTLRVSTEAGLQVNGKSYKLRGAAIHHDNGILGAVAIDRAERRKVEILKANGFNAIRCSHNPHSRVFYDTCDELGMLVMDELLDRWEQPKFIPSGRSDPFESFWRQDFTQWIRADRHHPCIVMWSLGNEIPEVATKRGVEIATQMRALVLELDSTRFISNALTPQGFGKGGEAARKLLDVSGYNYGLEAAQKDHVGYPNQLVALTENFAEAAYDTWQAADKSPWLLGEFLWTGIDYLGETGCGSSRLVTAGTKPDPTKNFMGVDMSNLFVWDYPAYQSGTGDIDILGLKKPPSFYRDVLWGRSPLELFVQRPLPEGMEEAMTGWAWHDELASWTWPGAEGKALTVRAYTQGDTVALLLDGKEIARKTLTATDKLKAIFTVPYAPGVLTAVAYANGKELGRQTLTTVGAAKSLRLRAEHAQIGKGPGELAYVFAEVVDAKGRLVPDAAVPITFAVAGPLRLLAAGSANPYGIESFQDAITRTFHGTALAILQPTTRRGEAIVHVSSPGLSDGTQTIRVG